MDTAQTAAANSSMPNGVRQASDMSAVAAALLPVIRATETALRIQSAQLKKVRRRARFAWAAAALLGAAAAGVAGWSMTTLNQTQDHCQIVEAKDRRLRLKFRDAPEVNDTATADGAMLAADVVEAKIAAARADGELYGLARAEEINRARKAELLSEGAAIAPTPSIASAGEADDGGGD